jgi:uncharacterized membrane protein YeaQ/YmgE (transglycosylase-associated protein family)
MTWLIYAVIVGLVAGYLSSRILGLPGQDWVKNLLIGLVGSFVGGLIGSLIGLRATNLIGSIILAVIGSCVSLYVYAKFIRK